MQTLRLSAPSKEDPKFSKKFLFSGPTVYTSCVERKIAAWLSKLFVATLMDK